MSGGRWVGACPLLEGPQGLWEEPGAGVEPMLLQLAAGPSLRQLKLVRMGCVLY